MPICTSRRRALQLAAGTVAAAATRDLHLLASTPAAAQAPQTHGAFQPLPLGEVKPAGWLARQLRIQADGMTGHLHELWPDVGPNSGWLGGSGESWERGPYFIDGLLPLAVLLDDARLRAIANKFVEWTLTHQQPNGMIGPASNDDWWPRMVMVKVLAQHYEATNDARVLTVLTRYFHCQLSAMPARPLRDWGKYRWQDEVYVVQWLYRRTRDSKLLELAALLRAQGFDWVGSFQDFKFKEKVDKHTLFDGPHSGNNPLGYQSHGVNNGQALKTAAVQGAMGDMAGNRLSFFRQLDALDRYHGMPTGMFTCDEHLAGTSPSQGTELCTVVETMFSLEVALAAFGDAAIADRLENIAYNALPATISADMWTHQYDQQVNQVQCGLNTRPWTTNGPESNLFGLAPHFGCCTANYHQGWPKFVASQWMRTPDDGLAAVLYGPGEVRTSIRGVAVHLQEVTDYPFRDSISVGVQPAKPIHFPLQLRVPAWAADATVRVNGKPVQQAGKAGTFVTVEREWSVGDQVEIKLPMAPRVSRWMNRSVAVQRGPLLFSHPAGEHWVKLRERGPVSDWQVFPDGPWNYALQVDERTAPQLRVAEAVVPDVPFREDSKPVSIDVPAHIVETWRAEDGFAPPPPATPVVFGADARTLTLVPYGTARIRTTVFPEAAG